MASGSPRYAQIYNTLSRRMEAGKYAVDTRLPTESELCDE
jgi:DNA-binding GntR family transcriptional regulator